MSLTEGVAESSRHAACEICAQRALSSYDGITNRTRCERCGEFQYQAADGWLDIGTPDDLVRLSGWVRDQNGAGVIPVITIEMSRQIRRRSLPGLQERAMRVLAIFARKWPDLTRPVLYDVVAKSPEIQGISYSRDAADVLVLLRILVGQFYLEDRQNTGAHLTVAGLLAAEALGKAGSASPQGFVAMSFDAASIDNWTKGFGPAIHAAGYVPFRIDAKDFVGGISDEIMAEIRRSRFVVADYTGQRGGVYFEAGFALGLGLVVIPTCRKDEVDKLHFDIKHLNTLVWETTEELSARLTQRIRAVMGQGPIIS